MVKILHEAARHWTQMFYMCSEHFKSASLCWSLLHQFLGNPEADTRAVKIPLSLRWLLGSFCLTKESHWQSKGTEVSNKHLDGKAIIRLGTIALIGKVHVIPFENVCKDLSLHSRGKIKEKNGVFSYAYSLPLTLLTLMEGGKLVYKFIISIFGLQRNLSSKE